MFYIDHGFSGDNVRSAEGSQIFAAGTTHYATKHAQQLIQKE